MSRYKFCRTFKGTFGQSFKSYLNSIRVRNAAELLKNTHLNVTEITYFVGFGSVVNFERVFKDIHGATPLEYRRKLREGD
jgi:transcriptional regulator GlxA family with amidase domain